MPRDATNMPNPRPAPYREGEKVTHAVDKLDTTLNIENMLLEEFNYASVAAYQAMEDRARMFNIYLLLIAHVCLISTYSSLVLSPLDWARSINWVEAQTATCIQ